MREGDPPRREAGPRVEDERSADVHLQRSRPPWQRALWALLGLGFVAIGAIGVVVPGLPTTPLLLLAAACFARSSPRLYDWLLRNRTFGPLIEDYRAGLGVSARVKTTAIAMMSGFVAFAVLVPLREKPIPAALVLALAVFGAIYILRLPTRPRAG
ncbi:MAG: YbaN family protein [Planctomycetota bacterium]